MPETDVKEIRESFETDDAIWAPIRTARHADIKAIGPDSTWDDRDRRERKDAGRPCLSFDELGQYVNQLVNDARETKRAIEVNPSGAKTSEHQASFFSALIRQIEYRSNAQLAYTQMFEDAAQGSYGFCRVVSRYIDERLDQPSLRSFDQELFIEPVPNAALITPGFFTKPDLSDCKRYWVDESYSHEEFKEAFGDAKIRDFSSMSEAGSRWVDAKRVWVRELWELKAKKRKLVLLPPLGNTPEPVAIWADTIEGDDKAIIEAAKQQLGKGFRERVVDVPYVCQTITNGLEILEKKDDWPGRYIPIIGCIGKVLWTQEERIILSLVRLALGPQQMLNYYRTGEAEMVSMTPKVPWFYYDGVLDPANLTALSRANQVPAGAIKVKASPDGWPAAFGPAPFPARTPYEPQIQAFEMGAESTRRAIQSATGTGFMPTEAQQQNQKSGVALKQIETSAQKGAYHFVDHYEHAVRRVGEVLVDLIPHYYDNARDLQVRGNDDKPIAVRINDPNAPPPKEFGDQPIHTTTGQFDITLSTGPGYADERDKASEFADQLVSVRPELFAAIGGDIVRLKNLGPIGDKLAEVLDALAPPPVQALRQGNQPMPPQAQQAMAQLQQAQQMIQQLQQIIQTEQVKGQTQVKIKELDGQIKLAIEELRGKLKMQQMGAQASVDIAQREDEQSHEMAIAGADAAHSAQAAEDAARQARAQQYLSGSSTNGA